MKKGFAIILGFAVGLAAVTFAQVIVQRPQFPQTGLSYVGYGDAFPTTELFGGELFVDVNGQTDAGPLFGIYDDVNTVWDIFFSGIGTQNTVVKFGAAELVDSSVTDDAVDVVATAGLFTAGTAPDAADSITIDGINNSIVFEGGTEDGGEVYLIAGDPDTDLVITLDNPPADTGGTWMELAAALAAQDAGDVWRGIYLNLDSPADHDGAAEIRGIELNSDLNTATGQEYALWINDRWDTEIWFEGNDANVVFPNTGNLTFNDAGGAHTFILDDVPAAGASDDTWSLVEIAAGLGALDAGDVQNGIFVNLANADHTGGNVYGLNIDGIVQDPQAEEAAVFIGATWDADIHFGSATAMMWWFETGNLTIQDYGGDMQFILRDVPAVSASADLMELDATTVQVDAGDTIRGLFIDLVTDAATTGGLFVGLDIDGITARAAAEYAVQIGPGWDIDIRFTDGTPLLNYPNLGTFTIADLGTAASFILRDVTAAGTANDLVEIDHVLSIMDDAGDVFRSLFIDIDSVDHTNGNIIGIDIDLDTPDAQATETAVYANGGWDYTLRQDGVAFADLPAVIVGAMVYCTNCDQASVPCATTGANGAWAFGTSNGPRWECPW